MCKLALNNVPLSLRNGPSSPNFEKNPCLYFSEVKNDQKCPKKNYCSGGRFWNFNTRSQKGKFYMINPWLSSRPLQGTVNGDAVSK